MAQAPAQRKTPSAAETLAKLGAIDAAAPAFAGLEQTAEKAAGSLPATAMTGAEVAQASASIVGALVKWGAKRGSKDFDWVVAALRRRYPEKTLSEVEALARREVAFEREFRRKQRLRMERDVPRALRVADPAEREAAVRKILEREKRYLEMRRAAMVERSIAAAELDGVRQASPQGAYWRLSPNVREHTLDCLALGEKFWPWEVLDATHPPLHHGCRCALYTFDEAVERGFMHEDQVPDPSDAVARATDLLSMAHEAMREGVTPAQVEEFRLARELDLAEADALEERARSAEFERETERIKERAGTPEARARHRFRAAKWTHPNGHPRCLLCGQEERIGGICNGEPTAAEARAWADRENREGTWGDSAWHVGENGKLALDLNEEYDVFRRVSPGVRHLGEAYYGELAWQRFGTGFHEGGQFKGRRTGVRTRALERKHRGFHLLSRLVDLATPAQKRQAGAAQPTWLNGQHVNVPEHRQFDRTIGGVRFTSPPGSTNVYSGGKLLGPDHPLRRPGKPVHQLGERVLPTELKQGDHFVDSSGQAFRVERAKPARKGGVKLSLRKAGTDYTAGTFKYEAQDQGFRRIEAPRVLSPEEQRAEQAAEQVRHELGLPAVSFVASALERMDPSHPPVAAGTDGAAADGALRQAGFRETGIDRGPGATVVSYAHPDTGSVLRATFREPDGRVARTEWEPRGLGRQPAGPLLTRPPKDWDEFVGHLAGWVEQLGAAHGVETHLRSIVHDDSRDDDGNFTTPDHGGTHQWNGDLILGADVRRSIEKLSSPSLDDRQKRDAWGGLKAALHEALHAVNPVDQQEYETPTGRAMEEWLTEDAAHLAAVEQLRKMGRGDVADWAAANQGDWFVRGAYLGERAAGDRLLSDAGVAPEARPALIQELKLRVPPAERPERLAALLAEGNPRLGSLEQAREHVARAFARPPDERGWVPPFGVAHEAEHRGPSLHGTQMVEGTPLTVNRRVRTGVPSRPFETRPEQATLVETHPLGGGNWVATVRFSDGAVRRGVLPREIVQAGPQRSASSEVELNVAVKGGSVTRRLAPGDEVVWGGRADGGLSRGRVVRVVQAQAPTGTQNTGWAVEVEAGDQSMAPGAHVVLTQERTGGVFGRPEDVSPGEATRAAGGPVRAAAGRGEAAAPVVPPGAATRGKPTPGFLGPDGGKAGKPGWQQKVYGSGGRSAPSAEEPPLDPLRVNNGDVVRDPEGGMWRAFLTGTNDVPTITLKQPGLDEKTLPEGDQKDWEGWRYVQSALGSRRSSYSKPKTPKAPEHDDAGQLTFEKHATGGGRWYRDQAGERWLVRNHGGREDQMATELLANAVYREMGANVPQMGAVSFGGKPWVGFRAAPAVEARRWTDSWGPSAPLSEHFMTDALVANHDFVGRDDENVLWEGAPGVAKHEVAGNPDARPLRADHGGSFFFRQDGRQKPFGPVPVEAWQMLSPLGQGFRAVQLTDAQKREQASAIADRLTPERVGALVDAAGFKDGKMKAAVRDALNARVEWMGRFGRGEEQMPEPLQGAEAERELEGGQRGLEPRPAQASALGAVEDLNDRLRVGRSSFTGGPADEAQLELLGGAGTEPVPELPAFPGPVEVGKPLGPTEEEALKEWGGAKRSKPRLSAGVVVVEPDGRVWMQAPRGGFGGYQMILPKGGVDEGEDPQEAALRELWEETGLTGRITGLVGDYVGSTGITRYYLAERTGGRPGPQAESERVVLSRPQGSGLKGRDMQVLRDAGVPDQQAWVEPAAEALDSLVKAAPRTQEDMTLWASAPKASLEPGATLRDEGFMAAAFDRAKAGGEGEASARLKITVPAGARVLAARPLGVEGGPDALFPRGQRLRVVEVREDDGDVVAEVVALP